MGLEERRAAEAEAGGRDQPVAAAEAALVVAIAFFACTRARSDGSEPGDVASLLAMAAVGLTAGARLAGGATEATDIAASAREAEKE